LIRTKMRLQGDGSEQDGSASGFAWVARELGSFLGQGGAHPHRDFKNTTIELGFPNEFSAAF
jgi:hypothetical protein